MGLRRISTNPARAANTHGCTRISAFLGRVRSRLFAGLCLGVGFAIALGAQTVCSPTPAYSPCEVVFELSQAELAAHPNPYKTVELRAEFRSPRHRTFMMPAFWDGGQRMVIRFAPTEAGGWDFRVSSNLESWNGKTGQFSAIDSDSPGFVRVANVHHFAYTAGDRNKPHLWMGDTMARLELAEEAAFQKFVDTRAAQKFTHIRGVALAPEDAGTAFPKPEEPDPGYFRRLDERIRYINQKGMTVDLLLAGGTSLTKLFPDWRQRERYVRYLIARYAGMNITWGGVEYFEDYDHGRDLMKEIGLLLKKEDPYQHPRSTGTRATSA